MTKASTLSGKNRQLTLLGSSDPRLPISRPDKGFARLGDASIRLESALSGIPGALPGLRGAGDRVARQREAGGGPPCLPISARCWAGLCEEGQAPQDGSLREKKMEGSATDFSRTKVGPWRWFLSHGPAHGPM